MDIINFNNIVNEFGCYEQNKDTKFLIDEFIDYII